MENAHESRPWLDDIPEIRPEHLRDARLYAHRWNMIRAIGPKKAGVVAEVGVAVGGFSRALIERFDPDIFWAIDTFALHTLDSLWGKPPGEVFGTQTHSEYYEACMHQFREKVHLLSGDGADALHSLHDGSVDLIYIDGSHHYADVKRDAKAAVAKIKDDGIIIFNDYVLFDIFAGTAYGIVPVVNDLVVNGGWKIIGFALQQNMFCDIAIQR